MVSKGNLRLRVKFRSGSLTKSAGEADISVIRDASVSFTEFGYSFISLASKILIISRLRCIFYMICQALFVVFFELLLKKSQVSLNTQLSCVFTYFILILMTLRVFRPFTRITPPGVFFFVSPLTLLRQRLPPFRQGGKTKVSQFTRRGRLSCRSSCHLMGAQRGASGMPRPTSASNFHHDTRSIIQQGRAVWRAPAFSCRVITILQTYR